MSTVSHTRGSPQPCSDDLKSFEECSGPEDCSLPGQSCIAGNCEYDDNYCDSDIVHNEWTDKDKECLFQSIIETKDEKGNLVFSEVQTNCIVKNIVKRYSLSDIRKLKEQNDEGDINMIINNCIEETSFSGNFIRSGIDVNACTSDNDCKDDEKCKQDICKSKSDLSVGFWIILGILILLLVLCVVLILKKNQSKYLKLRQI